MRNLFFRSILFVFCTSFSSISAQTLDTIRAKAQKSDGIYAILRNNGFPPNAYIKDFLELNKKKLNGGTSLVLGEEYVLAVIKRAKTKTTVVKEVKDTKTDTTKATITKEQAVKKKEKKVITEAPPKEESPKSLEDSTKNSQNEVRLVGLPTSNDLFVNYPLFGEELSQVEIENNDLKGAIFYLISGHGGPDPGSVETVDGKLLAEDEYAYDVTLRLCRYLIARGAKVTMIIRDKNDGIRDERLLEVDYDEVNYPSDLISLDQKTRLKQRVDAVNDLYAVNKGKYQRLVTIHVDSRSRNNHKDVFFYHHKKSTSGKLMAQRLQSTFRNNYRKYQPKRRYSGTVTSRTLYVVKNTHPTMVYVELGNIKNPTDQKRLFSPKNREVMAKWLGEGLLLDYEKSK
ncbi:N-acetylmuramoyl-L-alanine amidase family protein [Spongiivirga citrea]|uniref:N-acetylmuramoyl-L-alanine amidase n=1 Tax=Spongiivirga citrea TaxID=1481457 RepID=A0A6M0CL35_9FLAO|nr:N-acetylmuramoyl-L-alanine amidase [Spongiivirga citrea]NER16714.1 N-acetylmuramoyl-L-alanine amidase [Spongiivirga citrea]